MPIKHVDKLTEAYLNHQLSPQRRKEFEAHVRECPICAQRLFDTQRLRKELGPIMQTVLGNPKPAPVLRHKVRDALEEQQTRRWFYFNWGRPIQILNAAGNVALLALLAFGAFVVIRGQIPGVSYLTGIMPSSAGQEPGELLLVVTNTPQPTPTQVNITRNTIPQIPFERNYLEDTIPTSKPAAPHHDLSATPTTTKKVTSNEAPFFRKPPSSQANRSPQTLLSHIPLDINLPAKYNDPLELPAGTIAYALFDRRAGLEIYRTHLISPDGSNHRFYSLNDASEPALYPDGSGDMLAVRTWNETSHPRRLVTTDLSGEQIDIATNFWEDAQPDWSPTEPRLIFASQRESDRKWRLYTAWEDGSLEVNLRREGKSPTFAPDGYRFAFESCDEETGKQCGLWLADLEHSEQEAGPFLEDPLAKSPDWSPNSEVIAYMANPDDNWDLYLVNSDGSNIRRLTNSPARDGLPTWSPDGEWLAFVSDRDDGWGLWILHVDSGALHQTISFENHTLAPDDRRPYNEHGQRAWWDEQLSWAR